MFTRHFGNVDNIRKKLSCLVILFCFVLFCLGGLEKLKTSYVVGTVLFEPNKTNLQACLVSLTFDNRSNQHQ